MFSSETNSTKASFPHTQLIWSIQTVSLPSLLAERSKAFWRGTQFWCGCIPHQSNEPPQQVRGAAAGSHSAPHNSRALMVGESNPEKPPLMSEGHSSSCRAHCSFQLSPQEDSSANPNMVTAPPGRQAEAVQADQQCSVLLPAAQSGWRPGVGTGSGLIQHVHQ